jgi:type II secretory pathway predicted ATPase ExeA
MFLDFYGFREQPFGVTPDPRFLYLSGMHREALASLYYGIEAGRGFLSLIARPGMGKTTLLFQLLEEFRNAAKTAFLFQTQCDSREFIRFLLAELGIDSKEQDRVKMHEEFNAVLLREMKAGKRFVVVIDEAQNLDDSVLETVRLLSNFETPRAKLMQIILSGQPELADTLARSNLSQLRQRISIVARLQPLAPRDVNEYIQHRLKVAGYHGQRLFQPDAVGAIIERSEGIPRTINNLCFNALSLGYALGHRTIERGLIEEITSDLDLEGMANRPRAPQFSIPFNSPIFAPTANWGIGEEISAEPVPETQPINGQGNSSATDTSNADAELKQLVEELNATVAVNSEEPATEAVAPVQTKPEPLFATPSSSVHQPPKPIFTVPASQPASPAPARRSMQVVARRSLQPPSKWKKLAKPAIFTVLAVDILLGTIFILHQRNGQPVSAAENTASASVMATPSSEHDGMLVSDEDEPSRTESGVPMRVTVPADVMRDNLVRMVPPKAPASLNSNESVKLQASIGQDGNVRGVKALNGDPDVAKAAEDAVRQWRYKPYMVNGKPADIETQVQVNFVVARHREAR